MHEDPVQVSSFHTPDLDGLVAPAHDLPGPDVGNTGGQLAPLQHDVLCDLEKTKLTNEGKSIQFNLCVCEYLSFQSQSIVLRCRKCFISILTGWEQVDNADPIFNGNRKQDWRKEP